MTGPNDVADSTALFLDLYHLDAAYTLWRSGMIPTGTFDLYTRRTPFGGGFMLVAGLDPALDAIQRFHFTDAQIDGIRALRSYDDAFLAMLRQLRFTGDILAMPEGEIAFADEPLMRVTAPMIEALLLESLLLRAVGVSTLVATKAVRLTLAADGATIADFSLRRAQAPELATRAAHIGGCDSTSYVGGALLDDIPATGTIPHALVQAYSSERDAFRAVAAALPNYSLLLDTYDVQQGISNAVAVAREESARSDHRLAAVRLDSGDLVADSRMVRQVLDAAGLENVKVLVSGDIDEHRIREIVASGAPVDGYGVGGSLGVGLGSVATGTIGGVIGAVYKLVWVDSDDEARIKLAGDKSTWPGRKQVWRAGQFERDAIMLEHEPAPEGVRALLQPAIVAGERVAPVVPVTEIRGRALAAMAALPERLRSLEVDVPYPVEPSAELLALRDATATRYRA